MGKRGTRYANRRKTTMRTLDRLCNEYFGKKYEWWSWENTYLIDDLGHTYKVALELPKVSKSGKKRYTDPYITTANGEMKGLEYLANKAIDDIEYWIEAESYN